MIDSFVLEVFAACALSMFLLYVGSKLEEAHQNELNLEICLCAAIRVKSKIILGHRHHDCMRTASVIGYEYYDIRGCTQGFLTSKNRFVNREDGLRLQLAAGVPSAAGRYRTMLFSEDLY